MSHNKQNNYSVYRHLFPNGKNYIGLTKQVPRVRWGSNGIGYKSQPVFEKINKYGWDNIEHIIIKDKMGFKEAQELEIKCINEFNSIENGYNISLGGGLGSNPWLKIEYNNKIYTPRELLEFSKLKDLTEHDITTRYTRGWDIEDILKRPKTIKNTHYEYKGKLYNSTELLKISSVKGLTVGNVINRINKHGWDIERAITQPKDTKLQPPGCRGKDKECLYEYNGKMYKTYELVEMSNVMGLNVSDITCRINKHGWSVEDAITKPKRIRNIKYEYKEKLYTTKELVEISPIKDLTIHHITDRINRQNWTVEKAINTPVWSKK